MDDKRRAFGGPGIEPRWTGSAKDGVGTAYATSSRIWFTLSLGILNEVYYPTIDRPQLRDLQYLVTDGRTFFADERRRMGSRVERLSEHALGYRVTNDDPAHGYRIVKEIIADPHQACVLIHTALEGPPAVLDGLRLFALCAPHLEVGGWHNTAEVISVGGRRLLAAHKGGTWMVLGASIPFLRCSSGYVGVNDGWHDLADNFQMDWEFDEAADGNVALIGELDLHAGRSFTLALAFGDTYASAVTTLLAALSRPFPEHRARFIDQWDRACSHILRLDRVAGDDGRLYHVSQGLLLAHEDKTYPGAMIASLSIPWGDTKGDDDLGGYHLVWTRDMVHSAMGLLAAGDMETPLRALVYLAAVQRPDGGFFQNFWLNGAPYWQGVQLDEAAFPILLAWRLHILGGLQQFDPYTMVMRAAAYLIRQGPVTPQERWEEAGGYSPSTLAVCIAALTCAAQLARLRGDASASQFLQVYADFLESRLEGWTVTSEGTLVPGIRRHYIRIRPVQMGDAEADDDPNTGVLVATNQPPDGAAAVPAKEVVDPGFLELVRYGIRRAGDPLIEDSLRVVDAVLKVETPFGPCWHRYNHDGYGQRSDGGPFEGWGTGRAWPLLTGERGHYELAADRSGAPFIRAMEGFAHGIGLLPEQIWDEADRPDRHLFLGRPTGSAMPLMWAHAEYVKLLRSARDGAVFDLIPEVAARYQQSSGRPDREIWQPTRHARTVRRGATLRIQAPAPFRLRWTGDEWQTVTDTDAAMTTLGIASVDIAIPAAQRAPVRFTFYWTTDARWEGRDYVVAVI